MANRFLQASLTGHFGNELDFGTCKIDSCGSNIEAFAHIRNDDIGKLGVADEHIVDTFIQKVLFDAQTARGIALRIEVDKQHLFSHGA